MTLDEAKQHILELLATGPMDGAEFNVLGRSQPILFRAAFELGKAGVVVLDHKAGTVALAEEPPVIGTA